MPSVFDQARDNTSYWLQWAQNSTNIAVQCCFDCLGRGGLQAPPVHLRDTQLCLDCHGKLKEIASYVFRCEGCNVLHGFSGGNSSPYARFHRSGLLIFKRSGIEFDFSERAKLSEYPPFQKWLSRRRS
jgi:hypothetical protein